MSQLRLPQKDSRTSLQIDGFASGKVEADSEGTPTVLESGPASEADLPTR
jgi:hypothetical protein